MKRSEHAALIALLHTRPDGLSWPEITAEVLTSGSALNTWRDHMPDTLFADAGEHPAVVAAHDQLESWEKDAINFLSVLDREYPIRLRGIYEVPPMLFWQGALLAEDPAVSVVGSRNASERGLRIAGEVARALIREDVTAVAGLATGIDTAVHRAALDAGGRTVAVIGTGITRYYPAANRGLHEEIARRGLLLSQFWPDAPPQRHNFLMRNATMSGYGLATVVVEAGEMSGTRVQARKAVEHGRAVILTDEVVRQNEWARKLEGRPGVYRADSLREVLDTVRHVMAEQHSAEAALSRLRAAL
ncbi:DNA-processing protein DprA [Amycolatopsis jejuensis]|uniref:DNA-processing protein DprA n=1 Tax=Amycolatopsis jejuensis TaxID=330084 RepID=UPI000524DDE6|nr:DNA-processing protein DprA [Amycolatopsis jejuensis]